MGYLLDSHVWVWILFASSRLSTDVISLIRDRSNRVVLSAATLWEVAVKYRAGRIALPAPPGRCWNTSVTRLGFSPLDIAANHVLFAANLPMHHRDPFDRVLLAQAKLLDLTLITADRRLAAYGVPLLIA